MQVRGVTGGRGRAGSCIAFVMHLMFTSSSLTLPSSPCPGGAWVRSPPALSKATFLFRQLLNLLLTGTESFWGASSIPGGGPFLRCIWEEVVGDRGHSQGWLGSLLLFPAVSLPC